MPDIAMASSSGGAGRGCFRIQGDDVSSPARSNAGRRDLGAAQGAGPARAIRTRVGPEAQRHAAAFRRANSLKEIGFRPVTDFTSWVIRAA